MKSQIPLTIPHYCATLPHPTPHPSSPATHPHTHPKRSSNFYYIKPTYNADDQDFTFTSWMYMQFDMIYNDGSIFFFSILRKSLHWKPSWRMPKKNCSQLKQRLRSVSFACCCLQSYCFIIVFLLSFIDYAISQQVPIQLYNNAWISSSNNSIWYKISVLSKVYFYTLWVS